MPHHVRPLTADEIAGWKACIDAMSHVDMARLWQFASIGHPVFRKSEPEVSDYFDERFRALGGMTPEVSKAIGLAGG